MLFVFLLVTGLPGCVQEDSEPTGPLIKSQDSSTTFSGYSRAGIMFSR